jgi:hypothetical protein
MTRRGYLIFVPLAIICLAYLYAMLPSSAICLSYLVAVVSSDALKAPIDIPSSVLCDPMETLGNVSLSDPVAPWESPFVLLTESANVHLKCPLLYPVPPWKYPASIDISSSVLCDPMETLSNVSLSDPVAPWESPFVLLTESANVHLKCPLLYPVPPWEYPFVLLTESANVHLKCPLLSGLSLPVAGRWDMTFPVSGPRNLRFMTTTSPLSIMGFGRDAYSFVVGGFTYGHHQ